MGIKHLHYTLIFFVVKGPQQKLRKHCNPMMKMKLIFCSSLSNGMKLTGKNRRTREKPVPVPLCLAQIPHGLTLDRTRASAVGGWRLTAWAMAGLQYTFISCILRARNVGSLYTVLGIVIARILVSHITSLNEPDWSSTNRYYWRQQWNRPSNCITPFQPQKSGRQKNNMMKERRNRTGEERMSKECRKQWNLDYHSVAISIRRK
jgi:hypothetical protein